jgi:hypothetical protein
VTVSKEDLNPEEPDKYKDLLIDALLDDISYFSEERGLVLNVGQNKGSISLSHKGSNNAVTMIHFIYLETKEQIVFTFNETCYLYTPRMFLEQLIDYCPENTTFKSVLKNVFA